MTSQKLIEVMTGGGAAWRARYVKVRGVGQVLSFGVDPNDGTRPQAFGNVGRWSFRFGLPRARWHYPSTRVQSAAYKVSQWFWHGMDGRYGWGSELRKRRKAEAKAEAAAKR